MMLFFIQTKLIPLSHRYCKLRKIILNTILEDAYEWSDGMVNEPAGFWIRFGAILLDAIIVGIPLAFVTSFIVGNVEENWLNDTVSFLYSLLLPVFWRGYTIGKYICGIKIRKVSDEGPPGIGTMLLRDVVAGLVYAITFGIGTIVSVLMVAIREDKRSLHDFIAGTEVVRN